MVLPVRQPVRRHARQRDRGAEGVESNARLTGSVAVVLLVLLAIEGFTLLEVRQLLTLHVIVGMLVVPPIVLKMGSTAYRFVRYYAGSVAYREKGPPPLLLRVLGPLLMMLTLVLLASGIAALFVGQGLRGSVLTLHKASFVLWFGVMTIHVLGHLRDTQRLATRDLQRRTRGQAPGAGLREWAIAASLLAGVFAALLVVGRVGPYLSR